MELQFLKANKKLLTIYLQRRDKLILNEENLTYHCSINKINEWY